jgi:YqaJ-like viral recombinase domain
VSDNTSLQLVQNSPEWRLARCGSVGASDVPDAVRKVKSGGVSASRMNLIAVKVLERLTGVPYNGYRSRPMEEGHEKQPLAAAAYAFMTDAAIEPIGLVRHPRLEGAHASPDGLIGPAGLIEIKCPQPAAHLDMLMTERIDRDYLFQMQWQMACTARAWCDFVSFNPDFPPAMQLWVKRVPRSEEAIAELEAEVALIVREIDYRVSALRNRYGLKDVEEAA